MAMRSGRGTFIGTDSGVAPTVHFVIDDMESLRSSAYEDAMKKARARADKLAELGGVKKILRIFSVREGGAGKVAEDIQTAQVKAVANMFGTASASSETVSGFEVTVEVELAVEYAIGHEER